MDKPSVAQRTLKFLPLASVILATLVWGASQIRIKQTADCDKHKESKQEIEIQRARMQSGAAKIPDKKIYWEQAFYFR